MNDHKDLIIIGLVLLLGIVWWMIPSKEE